MYMPTGPYDHRGFEELFRIRKHYTLIGVAEESLFL